MPIPPVAAPGYAALAEYAWGGSMSTVALDASRVGPAVRSRFFAQSALLMLALALLPFIGTYAMPMASGGQFAPIYHLHGASCFAWIMLFAWQAQLVATGRIARHRELGLAGIAISALIVPLGIAITIAGIQRRIAAGDATPFDNALFNVVDISTFALLMIASIAAVTRHSDWHRRFAFGAALCLVGPAISRFLPLIPSFPPVSDMLPNLAADLFLVALVVHDRRTLGRVHPATLWMIAGLVPLHIATPLMTSSEWWRAIAPALDRIMG
jgi:hypothetical protein